MDSRFRYWTHWVELSISHRNDGVENEKIKGLYGEKFGFSTEFGSVRRLPGKDESLMRFLGKTAPIGQLQYAGAFTS